MEYAGRDLNEVAAAKSVSYCRLDLVIVPKFQSEGSQKRMAEFLYGTTYRSGKQEDMVAMVDPTRRSSMISDDPFIYARIICTPKEGAIVETWRPAGPKSATGTWQRQEWRTQSDKLVVPLGDMPDDFSEAHWPYGDPLVGAWIGFVHQGGARGIKERSLTDGDLVISIDDLAKEPLSKSAP